MFCLEIHHVKSIVAFGQSHHNLAVNLALGRLFLKRQAFTFLLINIVHPDNQVFPPLRMGKHGLHLEPDRLAFYHQSILEVKGMVILNGLEQRFTVDMIRKGLLVLGAHHRFHIDLGVGPEIARIHQIQLLVLAAKRKHRIVISLVVHKEHALVVERECRGHILKCQVHVHRQS